MIIMETNPSMYMIIVVAIITATTFTTAQTTAQTTIMTVTEEVTEIETDSTTDTTTSDANTLSFTTNSSLSSSSLMTTTLFTGSTLTSSSLISTMSTDSATPHSGMTTVQEVTTQDDNSTMSSTINTLPPSSSPSLSSTDSTGISEQTSPSSASLITIPEETNMTTSASYTTSTTSEPRTEAPTQPPAKSPTAPPVEITTMTTMAKVGPVPEPTFPDLGGDAEKTYQFEFAVAENTAAGCNCTNLSSADCESFQLDITEELEDVYNPSTGYKSIEVNGLSTNSGENTKMGKGGIEIPDWRTYKVEDVPQLKAVQERLALRGLKDPWLRNEVWRFQPCFKPIPWYRFIFKGFPIGAGLFVVAVGLEKMFSKDDGHGHH